MRKLIAILIILIFSFENAGYCLRVPIGDAKRISNVSRTVQPIDKQTDVLQIKVEIYVDKQGTMRIKMSSIPECPTKGFLEMMRDDSRLRGRLFLLGGAVRDILVGKSPSDFDFVILDENGQIKPEPRMPANERVRYYKGIAMSNLWDSVRVTDYNDKQGVRRKAFAFKLPDLSINHVGLGFDYISQDPVFYNPDQGLEDLINRKAKLVGLQAEEDYLLIVIFSRLVEKMRSYSLTPTEETDRQLMDIIQRRPKQLSKQSITAYQEWRATCGIESPIVIEQNAAGLSTMALQSGRLRDDL